MWRPPIVLRPSAPFPSSNRKHLNAHHVDKKKVPKHHITRHRQHQAAHTQDAHAKGYRLHYRQGQIPSWLWLPCAAGWLVASYETACAWSLHEKELSERMTPGHRVGLTARRDTQSLGQPSLVHQSSNRDRQRPSIWLHDHPVLFVVH